MDVESIPITFGGAAGFQIQNIMAAVAACRAMNVGVAQIRSALRSFRSVQRFAALGKRA